MSKVQKLPRGIDKWRGMFRVRVSWQGKQVQVGAYERLGDARAALDIARSQIARDAFVPPATKRRLRKEAERQAVEAQVTLTDWAMTWLEQLEQKERSPSTIVTYRSLLEQHILPHLGDLPLVDITPDDINEFLADIDRLPATRNPKAKNNGITTNAARTLRACLNAAVRAEIGGLTVSPFKATVRKAHRVRAKAEGGDVATAQEVASLARTISPRYRLAVLLAAWCALRAGEVLGLNRGDFEGLETPAEALLHVRRQLNAKAGVLTPPKHDSTRTISIPPQLVPEIQAHLDAYTGAKQDSPVFATGANTRLTQSGLDKAWSTARNKIKPGFTFHDLRHTGLTLFAQQGATLAELLHRGGHSDVEVALRYQHATLERDRELTRNLRLELD